MQRKAWHNTYSSHSYCTNLQFWELKQRNRHSNNAKEESSFESRQKQDLYLVYRASRTALGSKQAHKKLVPAARSPRHSGLALDLTYNVHLVQRSVMSTSTHTHTPPRCHQGVRCDNFTFSSHTSISTHLKLC